MPDKPKFELVDRPNIPPPSEERIERNNEAATKLQKANKPSFRDTINAEGENAKREKDERILRVDRAGQSVLDEANRGEEAWHSAMRERRNETKTETIQREQGERPDTVENLRNGQINGKPRENSPEDLRDAAHIRQTADDIRAERAVEENKTKN